MSLFQLPEDVLYLVLSFLDCRSLCRLAQVCRRSQQFTYRDAVWRRIAKDFINTGMTRLGLDLLVRYQSMLQLSLETAYLAGDHTAILFSIASCAQKPRNSYVSEVLSVSEVLVLCRME
uniref:F-box domain-containing protein n=1 Tax=Astyanax mexicanus TaxID=7994 RepID=A0A8B9JNC8_ASTMX